MTPRTYLLIEDTSSDDPTWIVTFYMGSSEYDDDLETSDTREVSITAADFSTAARYAEQYLRKMQLEPETQDEWLNAEILSVELY